MDHVSGSLCKDSKHGLCVLGRYPFRLGVSAEAFTTVKGAWLQLHIYIPLSNFPVISIQSERMLFPAVEREDGKLCD